MPDRWAFEAIGVDLGVRTLFSDGGFPLGPLLSPPTGDTGHFAVTTYRLILAAFALVFLTATWLVLSRRTCCRETADRLCTGCTEGRGPKAGYPVRVHSHAAPVR